MQLIIIDARKDIMKRALYNRTPARRLTFAASIALP